jgi:hypothetical protein
MGKHQKFKPDLSSIRTNQNFANLSRQISWHNFTLSPPMEDDSTKADRARCHHPR